MDLIAWGNIGLMEAFKRFDPARGCKFSTYVTPTIKRFIKSSIQELALINCSDSIRARQYQYERSQRAFTAQSGAIPPIGEIAERAGISLKRALELQPLLVKVVSGSFVPGDALPGDKTPFLESLSDKHSLPPADMLKDSEMADVVEMAVSALPPTEQGIARMHYGGEYRDKPLSLRAIGRIYGVSGERIRQMKTEALRLLRCKLACLRLESVKD